VFRSLIGSDKTTHVHIYYYNVYTYIIYIYIYIYSWLFYYYFFLTLFRVATVFLLCTYRQRTTVARYGFPNTTLQLERIDLACERGVVETRTSERERAKIVTLTILLHPPEKSRVGRVRIIIKYYCQHRRRRRGKKTRVLCVCVHYTRWLSRVPSSLRIVNLKLKSVKKIFIIQHCARPDRPIAVEFWIPENCEVLFDCV
jgi:hypothetical protein